MNRRGLLGSILAAGFAPAIVGSSVLMPVRQIIAPSVVDMSHHCFVYIGGCLQVPEHDYSLRNGVVSFVIPPPKDVYVEMRDLYGKWSEIQRPLAWGVL